MTFPYAPLWNSGPITNQVVPGYEALGEINTFVIVTPGNYYFDMLISFGATPESPTVGQLQISIIRVIPSVTSYIMCTYTMLPTTFSADAVFSLQVSGFWQNVLAGDIIFGYVEDVAGTSDFIGRNGSTANLNHLEAFQVI